MKKWLARYRKPKACCGSHGEAKMVMRVITPGRHRTSRGYVDIDNRLTILVPYDLVGELVESKAIDYWRP